MTDIRDLDEWKRGRRGEILADIILARHGFTLLDAANTGDRATTCTATRPIWSLPTISG
jgi:hypothetical protein